MNRVEQKSGAPPRQESRETSGGPYRSRTLLVGFPGRTQAAETAVTAPPRRSGDGNEGASMVALKWMLMLAGAAVFGSAGALVAYDIYLSEQLRRLLSLHKTDESGADLGVGTSQKPIGKGYTLRVNFLGGHAGQGLR